MTAKTSTRKAAATPVAPVMEVEYHPEVASKGIDHSFAAAVKQTRQEGTPENTISRNAAKAETDKAEAAKRGTWQDAIKAAKVAYAADTRKLTALDKARAALLDTRCEVVRATAHLMTFPESHAKAGKTAGQPSQSVVAEALGINRLTFAPYFKAATELFAKFPELATEAIAITEDEREHVASFWKAEALRAKQNRERAAKKAEAASGPVTVIPGEGAEDSEGATGAGAGAGTDGRTSAITADTAVACMKLLADALDGMRDQKLGFTEDQAEVMQTALAEAQERVFALTVATK